ncbi:MAG: conjugal transfer protein TrbE, partial [Campylobacterales bacterium]|nr:conjugal transfer protein TrbE [Campylobacterales bacterium]
MTPLCVNYHNNKYIGVKKMLNLREFRDTAKGFADLLNYAFLVDDGVVINKDGSLSAAFQYQAPDVFSATEIERDTTAREINQLLNKLDGGWSIQLDSINTPLNSYTSNNESYFVDKVCKMIDEERRYFFLNSKNLYTSNTYITLTYLPPLRSKSKIADMMFDDTTSNKTQNSIGDKILKYFNEKLNEFEALAKLSFLEIKRLKQEKIMNQDGSYTYHDKLLSFLNACIVDKNNPIVYPSANMYIDTLLAYDFFTGVTPKIDNKFIQIITIEGYPLESYANILYNLSQLDLECRWNTKFVFLDNFEALTKLDQIRKKWKQKERGLLTQIFNPQSTKYDLDAVHMVQQTDSAIADVNSGLLAYGYHNTSVVVFNTNREAVEDAAMRVKQVFEKNGFVSRIEDINTVEAYLGSLPGHIAPNIRRSLIDSMNLAHLLPLSTLWMGNKYNECDKYPPHSPALLRAVAGTTPFNLNLHVGDIGHTLIFGPTGAGKSTLLATIVAQARRYHNVQIFAFDKGKSLYPLTAAAGGDHYDIGGDEDKLAFAPLSNLKTQNDIAWAEDWILTLIELQGIKPTPHHKELIHHALKLHVNNNSTSITDFISNVQNSELRAALGHYSIAGAMGRLLDAETDNLSMSNFSVFEIEELMNLKIEDAVPVLLYLFNRIEKSLDGRPSFLVLDEAWIMLGHEVFRDKIREWLKVLRKANCAVILATQSLSDAAKSGILDVLQESCPTKILLPNPEARNRGTENNWGPYDYYKSFGLNEREIEIISKAKPKREYYYKSMYGSRLFNLALGEFTLSFVGASSKHDIAKI